MTRLPTRLARCDACSQERHDVFKTELLCNAFMIAGRAYRGQMRRDGSSVLSHCVLTALSLADFGLDAQTVAAGLLKEVLRNNEQFRSQLEEFMPTEVVQLVDRVNTIGEIRCACMKAMEGDVRRLRGWMGCMRGACLHARVLRPPPLPPSSAAQRDLPLQPRGHGR